METCIHSVQVFLRSTSVQSWKIMFRTCSCIVKVSGSRFFRLWRHSWQIIHIVGSVQHGTQRRFLVFPRAFLQKDSVSRKSRVTTLFFTALYHPLFPFLWKLQCKISRARWVLPLLWRTNCTRRDSQLFLGFPMPCWIQMVLDDHIFLELFF